MTDEAFEPIETEQLLDLPAALHPYYRFNTYERAAADFFNANWKARSPDDDSGYMLVR